MSQPWLVEAVGTAEWTGVPLADVLDLVRIRPDAVDVVFTGADHGVERGVEQDYQRSLSLADALGGDVLVAYEMNGHPLPPQHGYPVRLVVPGWYGMAHVKWLTSIEVLDRGPGLPAGLKRGAHEVLFTTKPPGAGTGLGLSLCHELVTEMGGTLELRSLPGQGTRCRIELPLAR